MIQVLVANGADANAVDDDLDEDLAIICAAKRGRTHIVDFLLHVTDPIQEVIWTRDGLIDYVNAEGFQNLALKLDMDNEDWKLYEALCELHIGSASSCSYFFSADAFEYMGRSYFNHKQYHHAETAFKAALVLEPGNPQFLGYLNACIYLEFKQLETNVSLKESDAWPAEPQDAYGLEKLATEELCKHYTKDFGIECRVGHFHNIYGPFGTWKGGREKAPVAFCRKAFTSADKFQCFL